MCMIIYLGLFALLIFYSNVTIEQYALSVSSEGEWMVAAIGWEMIPLIWPLLLAVMVIASAVTWLTVKRRFK